MLTWCQEWPVTTETQKHTTAVLRHSQRDTPLTSESLETASEQPETCRFFSEQLQIDDAIYSGWEKRSRLDAEASRSLAHLSTGGVVP